jgi:hypothetical protein
MKNTVIVYVEFIKKCLRWAFSSWCIAFLAAIALAVMFSDFYGFEYYAGMVILAFALLWAVCSWWYYIFTKRKRRFKYTEVYPIVGGVFLFLTVFGLFNYIHEDLLEKNAKENLSIIPECQDEKNPFDSVIKIKNNGRCAIGKHRLSFFIYLYSGERNEYRAKPLDLKLSSSGCSHMISRPGFKFKKDFVGLISNTGYVERTPLEEGGGAKTNIGFADKLEPIPEHGDVTIVMTYELKLHPGKYFEKCVRYIYRMDGNKWKWDEQGVNRQELEDRKKEWLKDPGIQDRDWLGD